MRPRKNSGAAKLGIKFTGNPDARDYCEIKTWEKRRKKEELLANPGKYMLDSLS